MKKDLKRKLLILLCMCLVLGMAPVAAYAYPGDGGNKLDHMYTDNDLTYDENATVLIYATPGACEIVDEGGSNTYQSYRVNNFDGWYFEGWKTWYTGREYHWIFPDANEVDKANPKFDDGSAWYFSKYRTAYVQYSSNIYSYMKERITVNKEPGYRGTYYLYAIFRPILTVKADEGVAYTVNGAYQVTADEGVIVADQYAAAYGGGASVTYTVDPAYEVTGVSASYGTSYSVSGQTITVSGMVRPGSISINAKKKHAHDYASDWSSDENGHWRECSCGARTDESGHSGGTATCVSKAECGICESEYGIKNPGNHAGGTEIRGHAEAGEFTEGYTGDVYCKGCGVLIEAGKVIPASHKHEFPPAWSGDGNTHWHECTCGERADDAVHSGGISTCNSKAVCNVCAQPYGTVDKTNHSGGTEIKGYIEAAEFSAGYTGDTYCKGCGTLLEKGTAVPATHKHSFDSKWSTDDAIHWHECACGAKADAAGHTFADATCTDPMTCTVCGMTSGDAAGHDYKDGKCQVCGEDDADYVPPEEPSDPIDPSDPADPDDPAGKDDSSGEQNKESGTDKDASPKTGDDRSTTIYWILLVAALLIMRRVFKNRRR